MAGPAILDSDWRYIDKKGNLMGTRTELTVARMLDFLGEKYQYNQTVTLKNGSEVAVDFKTDKGLIEVIDCEGDIAKYKSIREGFDGRVMAIGHGRYSAQLKELQDIAFYDKGPETGSIFLDDGSFAFDYAHILPLVEKCSILHGHTSSVMVELAGQMKDNLLLDFGEAKRIIREALTAFDHKFFINKKYVKSEDGSHYVVSFDGPQGTFELQVPRHTTYLLEGEATVENLSSELIRLLAPKMPSNVEAVGVYIYEGYNKGSHIISSIRD